MVGGTMNVLDAAHLHESSKLGRNKLCSIIGHHLFRQSIDCRYLSQLLNGLLCHVNCYLNEFEPFQMCIIRRNILPMNGPAI